MCEQTETNYLDGDVVWVKLGSCWWPGEVVGPDKLPPDVLPSFRKPPIAVVKFYQEDTYEYVKNINAIYKYNCSRKNEFINKGLYMFRTKHGHMEKFPEDVIRAETAVGGDIEILTRDEFQETKKESYAGLFGDAVKKTPGSAKRGKGRPRLTSESSRTPIRKIKEKTDYKVHILVQGSNTPSSQPSQPTEPPSTPSTSAVESEPTDQKESSEENPQSEPTPPATVPSTPTFSSTGGNYSCHACSFSTTRLNVLILHNKTHSVSFTPYTPSPVRKKPMKVTPKSTPTTSKTPKVKRPRKEKTEASPKKSPQAKKRTSQDEINSIPDIKKPKTDEEIKSSLLADWDDMDDEESNDDSSAMVMAGSPEIAIAAESAAVPTPAELPSAQVPADISLPTDKKSDELSSDKVEPSSDSKYEFCEDEDWSLETDAGRKIPRVTNPSKRKDDTKSVSLDEDDVAREVAELLNKTTVPELPSVPESLKVEENFPEPSIVKSPDKKSEISLDPSKSTDKTPTETPPTKAIFKTKTFFRSRHSRSQDAIGKYVAEQLNAVERMDMSEGEINGSDAVSSPEARDSPPIEPVKVARLAPKIQLKKMKAEAAQLREKEKNKEQEDAKNKELIEVIIPISSTADIQSQEVTTENDNLQSDSDNTDKILLPNAVQDVLYPTQEIKPVKEEISKIRSSHVSEEHNKENITQVVSETLQDTKETFINSDEGEEKEETTSYTTEIEVSNPEEDREAANEKPLELPIEPYMNESTASAVDALLSVSRDADRVTRVISDDPPEDLFEDDNKDSVGCNTVNGFNEITNENIAPKIIVAEQNKMQQLDVSKDLQIDYNVGENHHKVNDNIQKNNIQVGADKDKTEDSHIENELSSNNNDEVSVKMHTENIPSESDLQIAETLLNLPSTAIQSKTTEHQEILNMPVQIESSQAESEICTETSAEEIDTTENMEVDSQVYDIPIEENKELNVKNKDESVANDDKINIRFETEQEKTENALNAAQSLVQMSESIDHKMNIVEPNIVPNNEIPISEAYRNNQKNGIDKAEQSVEQKVSLLSIDNTNEPTTTTKTKKFETTSSKLLKMLEEPIPQKVVIPKVATTTKQIIIPGKEKILNFDVAKSLSGKSQSPVIIRRAAANKTILNNIGELTTADKIILSRNNKTSQDGSSVQTYTMQASPDTPSDANTITIIQQKIRKVPKTPSKIQKPKYQASSNSLVSPLPEPKILNETPAGDDSMFDINSMPIVLSDDLLTPESIEKMPIVMSDGNLITNTLNPPKLVKTKQAVETEKIAVSTGPIKPEVKTLLMNPVTEVNKITTPNILSKSSKLRSGAKPMLVIDKATGNKKIIVTKAEPPIKEIKQAPTIIQQVTQNTGKAEKFIILPSASSPRPGRTQKIVIDPQTGKAHVLVSKGPEPSIAIPDNKPVSAKLVPATSDASAPGNTVMIITNAQGAQSRIVLTPEHEKILFPNKQQPNMSQLKAITQRAAPSPGNVQKILNTAGAALKTQTKIVPKQKSTIITSKGQLIVGGRVAGTAQNIAAMPEIRPSPKRIIAAEPKKVIQTIQKTTSEPLIFLQQKSGAVVQLTASQFEHFKRTGQIVQKTTTPVPENKIIVQKTRTISPNESAASLAPRPRIRKAAVESPTPVKKLKQEIAIAPAPPPPPSPAPVPALAALSGGGSLLQPAPPATPAAFPDLDNFEELLPSTAIARGDVPAPAPPPPDAPAPAPPPLSDGQLLAVPGEHFGGPPGSFYLCVEDNGTLTPIDNRPLVLENNQLVPMAVEPLPILAPQPERRDILEAALANSDVFHAETPRDDAPDFRDLNANVSVHCRVSETSTTLNQPIMTPVEVPSKRDSEPTVPSNLEDGLAVIGVTPHTVPTSLELPITVTDPRIAPKTTDPLSGTNYGPTTLLPSPTTEMTYVSTEEVALSATGPISMPLLTEEAVGKSMPILTEEVAASSLSSGASPEPDAGDDDARWSRRLLTPGSDTSEASAEIPLQPAIQLSVDDLERHS